MDLYAELLGLVDVLAERGPDYAICGGIAVAMYGHPRLTRDIDLLARPEDLAAILATVSERGFTVAGGRVPLRAGRTGEIVVHRVSKISGHEVLTLDIIIVNPSLDIVWKDRTTLDWKGRRVWIVSLDGLTEMKKRAGRRQDLADLENLGVEPGDDNDRANEPEA